MINVEFTVDPGECSVIQNKKRFGGMNSSSAIKAGALHLIKKMASFGMSHGVSTKPFIVPCLYVTLIQNFRGFYVLEFVSL